MTVIHLIARLNMGGPARHVIPINRTLRSRGHRTLLAHGAVGEGEASLERLAAEHGVAAVRIADLGRRISPMGDARAFLRLLRLVFRESPDVVHTHTAKAGTLGRLAALVFNATRPRRRRCLVVHTFHGHVLHGYFPPLVNRAVQLAERTLARATDRIVTISPSQQRDIVDRFRIARRAKTVAMPIGLDLGPLLDLPPDAPTYRDLFAIPVSDIVVGYVGRLVPIKDVPVLVAAFAQALRRRADLWLIVAGDGPERGAIEAIVRARGLGSRVRFLGWTDDLARVYATIDICALASRNEGTPVALIEAMAAGRAVAATRVGGVPDVVDEGKTGLLVPPGDADALAEAILTLAADADLRQRMGAAGRKRVAKHHAADTLAADVERLYVTGLAEKRGAS